MEAQGKIVRWRPGSPLRTARSAGSPWTVEVAAKVLSRLMPRPVDASAVRDRAISLGLLRHPDSGRLTFSLRTISRLLLIGYRQPFQAEIGTFESLREHSDAGRVVFVILNATEPLTGARAQTVFEVGIADEEYLTATSLRRTRSGEGILFRSGFELAWEGAGSGMIVGVPRWDELPHEGRGFFDGLRDIDGAYHWNSAECDTDRDGNVVRY